MADYKDIIIGTFNSLLGKARDLTENSNVREIYDSGMSRAKTYGRMAKLALEVNGESEELKKVYTEIGKLCYEMNKDEPEGYFIPLFDRVKEITASILAKEEEVQAMKEQFSDAPDISVEIEKFDDTVSGDEDQY